MYLRYFSTLAAQVVRTYPQLQCRRAVRCRLPMSRTRRAEPVPLLLQLASPRLACSPPKMKMTRKWCVEPVPAWMLPFCPPRRRRELSPARRSSSASFSASSWRRPCSSCHSNTQLLVNHLTSSTPISSALHVFIRNMLPDRTGF